MLALLIALATTPVGAQPPDPGAEARELLDQPFQFLLRMPGWAAREFTHDSDLFSTWGHLVLERTRGRAPAASPAQTALLRAGRAAGWRPGPPPDDAETPDMRGYGVAPGSKELTLRRSIAASRNEPPTRYRVRSWASTDDRRLFVLFRVDAE